MNITGIVAEYNPFHNGHLHQLTETRKHLKSDFIIAVMSGNFSQRGLPTIADKFIRTQMALSSGVDLVLELPTPFATASAERFAQASISLFHKTGIINSLSFGSECGDLQILSALSDLLLHPTYEFTTNLKNFLKEGESFPRARALALFIALKTLYPHLDESYLKSIIDSPNNILGIEYIKAIKKYNTSIEPFTIQRKQAAYHDTNMTTHKNIASATSIRSTLQTEDSKSIISYMPHEAYHLLDQHGKQATLDLLSHYLHYKLIISQKEDLYSLWDIPKELIHSLYHTFPSKTSYDDLVNALTSKTYTRATVQRALLRILLAPTSSQMQELEACDWIPYIRVLGCHKDATVLLKHLTTHSKVPIITNFSKSYISLANSDPRSKTLLDLELKATALYHSLYGHANLYKQDFTQGFVKY